MQRRAATRVSDGGRSQRDEQPSRTARPARHLVSQTNLPRPLLSSSRPKACPTSRPCVGDKRKLERLSSWRHFVIHPRCRAITRRGGAACRPRSSRFSPLAGSHGQRQPRERAVGSGPRHGTATYTSRGATVRVDPRPGPRGILRAPLPSPLSGDERAVARVRSVPEAAASSASPPADERWRAVRGSASRIHEWGEAIFEGGAVAGGAVGHPG